MTNDEILAAFIRPEAFPEEAVKLAGERREELVPLFIAEIEAWAEGRRKDVEGPYYLPDIAFHLLAEWRETRGFKPMLKLIASPQEEVLGDSMTEDGAWLLTLLYDGDRVALEAFLLDCTADEFTRNEGFEAYAALTRQGAIARDHAHAFLLQAFEALPHDSDYAWCGWAMAVSDLLFEDLVPKVKQLFAEEAIHSGIMEYKHFAGDLEAARRGEFQAAMPRHESPMAIMRDWNYVDPEEEQRVRKREDEAPSDYEFWPGYDGPAFNPYRDVGRNDLCPCGSGKKFKKCCLAKVEAGEM